MAIQPKTAIACRDNLELAVCLDILRSEGHTTDTRGIISPVRIYVCPEGYKDWTTDEHDDLEWNYGRGYVDNFECDEDDDFEWNYVEASNILRNQIISARLKGGNNVI